MPPPHSPSGPPGGGCRPRSPCEINEGRCPPLGWGRSPCGPWASLGPLCVGTRPGAQRNRDSPAPRHSPQQPWRSEALPARRCGPGCPAGMAGAVPTGDSWGRAVPSLCALGCPPARQAGGSPRPSAGTASGVPTPPPSLLLRKAWELAPWRPPSSSPHPAGRRLQAALPAVRHVAPRRALSGVGGNAGLRAGRCVFPAPSLPGTWGASGLPGAPPAASRGAASSANSGPRGR